MPPGVATTSPIVVAIFVELERNPASVLPTVVVRGRKNPLYVGLAVRLKRARKAARLSFDRIAEAAGLTDGNTVRNLESKVDHLPRLDTVEKIAHALELSPGFLAYGIDGQASPAEQPGAASVGDRLRVTRLARELSVRALAERSCTSHTAIGKLERGGTMPTVATVEALAVALSVSPAWLAYGTGPQSLPSRRRPVHASQMAR